MELESYLLISDKVVKDPVSGEQQETLNHKPNRTALRHHHEASRGTLPWQRQEIAWDGREEADTFPVTNSTHEREIGPDLFPRPIRHTEPYRPDPVHSHRLCLPARLLVSVPTCHLSVTPWKPLLFLRPSASTPFPNPTPFPCPPRFEFLPPSRL